MFWNQNFSGECCFAEDNIKGMAQKYTDIAIQIPLSH